MKCTLSLAHRVWLVMTASIALTLFAAATMATAQTTAYSIISQFDAASGSPVGNLISDSAGNLYGVTGSGGGSTQCQGGCGTVFKLSPTSSGGWVRTTLYEFTGTSDGSQPLAGLTFDAAGNLFGTTYYGGVHHFGVVFELSPTSSGFWKQTVLYAFQGGGTKDGGNPWSQMEFDGSGNLYGTTTSGGFGNCGFGAAGCGAVFQLSPNPAGGWSETIIYNFGSKGGLSDGLQPIGPLTIDKQGNLYGTTQQGGSLSGPCGYPYNGCGTVFRLRPGSNHQWTKGILHSFSGSPDGAYPYGGVILDNAGNLYGTAEEGGHSNACQHNQIPGCGVVFKLFANGTGWTESVLLAFEDIKAGNGATGEMPLGSLIFDTAGNLYGTTSAGGLLPNGKSGQGVIFQLSPDLAGWRETELHTFHGADGANPSAGLVFDAAGNLIGYTPGGGPNQYGLAFEIAP